MHLLLLQELRHYRALQINNLTYTLYSQKWLYYHFRLPTRFGVSMHIENKTYAQRSPLENLMLGSALKIVARVLPGLLARAKTLFLLAGGDNVWACLEKTLLFVSWQQNSFLMNRVHTWRRTVFCGMGEKKGNVVILGVASRYTSKSRSGWDVSYC